MLSRQILLVAGKELREMFATPMACSLLAVFWAVSGYLFSFNLFFVSAAHLVTAFHNISILLLLVVPLLTMRSFAEEAKTGTLDLLLTLPLADLGIVLGKFLAQVAVLALMLAGTATAVAPLVLFARPEMAPIFGGYLGVALLGAACAAVGQWVSSLCRNQIVAASITWAILTLLWFLDYGAKLGGDSHLFAAALTHLSFSVHYIDVIRGIVNLPTLVYFASVCLVALALNWAVLRSKRP